MRIHNWLDGILDSTSKVRIFRLFFAYPEREFTEREIAALIKMSPNTVNLALREIRKTNLLSYRRIAKAHVYMINRQSALYKTVRVLFEGEKGADAELFNLIRRHLCKESSCMSCIVFGSFARRDEAFDSDLDILVITRDKTALAGPLDKLSADISKSFGTVLSPITYTPDELDEKRGTKLIAEIRDSGILVCGKPLGDIHGKGTKDAGGVKRSVPRAS